MRTRKFMVCLLGLAGIHACAAAADATESLRGGATLMAVKVYTLEDDRKVLKAFDGLRVADVSDGMDFVGLQDTGLVTQAAVGTFEMSNVHRDKLATNYTNVTNGNHKFI